MILTCKLCNHQKQRFLQHITVFATTSPPARTETRKNINERERERETQRDRERERERERAVKSVWTSFQSVVVKNLNVGPTSHANAELFCPGQYA